MFAKIYNKDRIKQAEVIDLDKVKHLDIEWLWPGYIPLGMLTLIAGDPGVGKSFLTLYMAATVSTGHPWPQTTNDEIRNTNDGAKRNPAVVSEGKNFEEILLRDEPRATSHETEPGSVIILNNEDIPTKIICPRLAALDADLSKIKLIPFVWRSDEYGHEYSSQFNIATDIFALELTLSELPNPRLIIIDPLLSFFANKDTYRDSYVRASLSPLIALARKYNVAVVCVMHLNKGSSNRIFSRIMGSLAFSSSARTVWFVNPLPNPENKKKCLLVPAKNNLSENPNPLAFEIKDNRVIFDAPFGAEISQSFPKGKISKKFYCETNQPGSVNIESPQLNRAIDWLKNLLSDGNPIPSKKIFALAKEQGFTNWTLQRARKELHIKCFNKKNEHGKKYWSWRL